MNPPAPACVDQSDQAVATAPTRQSDSRCRRREHGDVVGRPDREHVISAVGLPPMRPAGIAIAMIWLPVDRVEQSASPAGELLWPPQCSASRSRAIIHCPSAVCWATEPPRQTENRSSRIRHASARSQRVVRCIAARRVARVDSAGRPGQPYVEDVDVIQRRALLDHLRISRPLCSCAVSPLGLGS